MSDNIIFHCSKPLIINGEYVISETGRIVKDKPTHTLAFEKYDEKSIIIGWAQTHSNDSYNKKTGRTLAIDRINSTKNRLEKFANRPILQLNFVNEEFLPRNIINNDFNYYFLSAINKLLDIDTIDKVTIYFRSTNTHNTVCSYDIIKDDIISAMDEEYDNRKYNEKLIAEQSNNKYIYATYKGVNKTIFCIQDKAQFYSKGLTNELNDDIKDDINDILNSIGFIDDIDSLIFEIDNMDECTLIKNLRICGLSYDFNLEAQFVK